MWVWVEGYVWVWVYGLISWKYTKYNGSGQLFISESPAKVSGYN